MLILYIRSSIRNSRLAFVPRKALKYTKYNIDYFASIIFPIFNQIICRHMKDKDTIELLNKYIGLIILLACTLSSHDTHVILLLMVLMRNEIRFQASLRKLPR